MGRVRGKSMIVVQRLFKTIDHSIERMSETLEFVARWNDGQPFSKFLTANVRGLIGQYDKRSQRLFHQKISADRCQDEDQNCGNREDLREGMQGLLHGKQRGSSLNFN